MYKEILTHPLAPSLSRWLRLPHVPARAGPPLPDARGNAVRRGGPSREAARDGAKGDDKFAPIGLYMIFLQFCFRRKACKP